jgi:hypothetical protein
MLTKQHSSGNMHSDLLDGDARAVIEADFHEIKTGNRRAFRQGRIRVWIGQQLRLLRLGLWH